MLLADTGDTERPMRMSNPVYFLTKPKPSKRESSHMNESYQLFTFAFLCGLFLPCGNKSTSNPEGLSACGWVLTNYLRIDPSKEGSPNTISLVWNKKRRAITLKILMFFIISSVKYSQNSVKTD
jgi:hypothetical protein